MTSIKHYFTALLRAAHLPSPPINTMFCPTYCMPSSKSLGRSPPRWGCGSPDPMEEAGAPSTVNCDKGSVPAPPGVFMVAPPEVPRNAGRKAKGRARRGDTRKERGQGHYKGRDTAKDTPVRSNTLCSRRYRGQAPRIHLEGRAYLAGRRDLGIYLARLDVRDRPLRDTRDLSELPVGHLPLFPQTMHPRAVHHHAPSSFPPQ